MEKSKPQQNFQARTESIRQMERTVNSLFNAVNQLGEQSDAVGKAMRQALSARCVTCKQELTGSELALLAHAPQDLEGNRIVRLRQSRCAREGCESILYKITFQKDAQIDWEKLFALAKACEKPAEMEELVETVDEGKPIRPLRSGPSRRTLIRAGALAGAVLLLAAWHQVYFGGKIPFFRVPEKWHVAVSSDGDEAHIDKAPAKEPAKPKAPSYNGAEDK